MEILGNYVISINIFVQYYAFCILWIFTLNKLFNILNPLSWLLLKYNWSILFKLLNTHTHTKDFRQLLCFLLVYKHCSVLAFQYKWLLHLAALHMFHFQHHQPYPIFCQILKREKKREKHMIRCICTYVNANFI